MWELHVHLFTLTHEYSRKNNLSKMKEHQRFTHFVNMPWNLNCFDVVYTLLIPLPSGWSNHIIKPGILAGLHMPEGPLAFDTQNFKDPRGSQQKSRACNPTVLLASSHREKAGTGTWSMLCSDRLWNICLALEKHAAFPCFSSLLSCM